MTGIRNKKISNKKITVYQAVTFFTFYFLLFTGTSQQMPYYTQFNASNVFLNPAATGTRGIVDVRLNYRKQWVGFDDAPVTQAISLNSRLMKGSMGVGVNYFNDKTGPTRRSDMSFAYSYHAKFEDVELSAGLAYEMLTYFVDGTKINLYFPFDNTIDLTTSEKKKVSNASAGILFYNDRFHIGFSMLNMLEPTINYYPNDPLHQTKIQMAPHIYGNVGYNWSGQPDWIWENSLQVLYAEANPMVIDYNLRLHYLQKVFGGISIRLGDAIGFHIGATFQEDFHISYSYDLVTSSLRTFQAGSHEIMLIWSSNFNKGKKRQYDISRFKRQKYGLMF